MTKKYRFIFNINLMEHQCNMTTWLCWAISNKTFKLFCTDIDGHAKRLETNKKANVLFVPFPLKLNTVLPNTVD